MTIELAPAQVLYREIALLERALESLKRNHHAQPPDPELYHVPSPAEWTRRLEQLQSEIRSLKRVHARLSPRLIPGCGGTEVPILARNGRKYLWCWDCNATGTWPGDHVYVDCATDMPITPEEHREIFG